MDLKFIETLLQDHIDTDGTLRLSKSAADPLGAFVTALYPAFFNEKDFVVKEAGLSLLSKPDRVLLTGTGGSSPFDALPLRAYFTVAANDPNAAAVEIIANPKDGWFFPDTFAVLGGSFFDTLEIGSPGFTLRSQGTTGAEGFRFAGTLRTIGDLQYLSALLRGLDAFEVAAEIAMAGDVPEFELEPATLVPAVQLGNLPPFELRILARVEQVLGILETRLLLEGRLSFTKADGTSSFVAVAVDLTRVFAGIMDFVGTTGDGGLRLSDVVRLSDDADVVPTMPPVFSMLDTFALTRWEMLLDARKFQPTGLMVQLQMVKPWDLVPDLLSVQITTLALQVLRSQQSWTFGTMLNAELVLHQDTKDATIAIQAVYPGFQMYGVLTPGSEIDVTWLVTRYIGKDAADWLPDTIVVDDFSLLVAPATGSFSFYISISTDWPITIGAGSFSIKGFALGVSRLAQRNTALAKGTFELGAARVPVDVTATYDSQDGWTFDGGLTPSGPPMPLLELIGSYFDPTWKPQGTELTVNKFRVTFKQKESYYHFIVDARWDFDLDGFKPPALKASADIEYFGKKPPAEQYKGFVKGEIEVAGMPLGVEVKYPEKDITIYLGALKANIAGDPTKITVSFPPNKSVGDLIAMLVSAATRRPYTLPAPWDVLNLIKLSDFTLEIYPTKTPIEIGLTYKPDKAINFWFLEVGAISLWYRRDKSTGKNTVTLSITEGSFLGTKIDPKDPPKVDPLDPAKAPKVPGAGGQFFTLDFLAVGQRVALRNQVVFTTITQAIDDLQKAFKPPDTPEGGSPISGTGLVASDRAGWLVGLHATLLTAIDLRVVFLDPDLYGLAVSISGTKFPKLTGLKFEILYKRINETVGVYQLELRVPDFLRQLEFGAVSVTLPIIGIEIFTNGNFRLDFGFPARGDFTRSFAIQMLPFTGAGGFYFGWLSGATAKRCPQTTHGEFNPVIEAGIGLRVGLGRDINKGILKAGLSLTVAGIIEGTLAFYHPNDGDERYENALYYYVSGQIALVGQIYGEINFAIISARLDVLITIGAGFVIEAYEKIILTFIAEIRVSLTVKINLGLFKISISLSFKATLSEQFTIGSGSSDKPWNHGLAHLFAGGRALSLSGPDAIAPADLGFHPVVRTTRQPVLVYLMPQLTPASAIAGDVVEPAKAKCVAMLYLPTTVGQAALSATPSAFDEVARGALVWTLAAYLFPTATETPDEEVLESIITLDGLDAIRATLDETSTTPLFTHHEVIDWFERYFTFTVTLALTSDDEGDDERQVAVFPMLTPIVLKRPDGIEIAFADHEPVDRVWFDEVREYFAEMNADYLSPEREAEVRRQRHAREEAGLDDDVVQPLAGWMMVDYVMLLAKGAVQAAIDEMRAMPVPIADDDSLQSLLEREPFSRIELERLVRANRTRPLRPGARLELPPFRIDLRRGDSLGQIASRFGVPFAAVSIDEHWLDGLQTVPRVRISGAVHQVAGDGSPAGGECLLGIARSYGVSTLELAVQNAGVHGLFAPGRRLLAPDVDQMKVRDLLDRLQQQARFEHLAGSASRFLLHGLRPPPPKGGETEALYAINGQQFDVSSAVVGTTFDLHVPAPLDWLRFAQPPIAGGVVQDPTKLVVAFDDDEIKVIDAFNGLELDPQIQSLTAMPFYEERSKAFVLGSAIEWRPLGTPAFAARASGRRAANAQYSLWAFPQNLLSMLLDDPDLRLAVTIEESTTDAPHLPLYAIGDRLPVVPYTWALRVDITLRQVDAPGGVLVQNTYELWGADVGASEVLQHLLTFTEQSSPIAGIEVLYAPSPMNNTEFIGLYSKPIATTSLFLVQTNLSTAANPDVAADGGRAAGAPGGGLVGMTALEFLRLVWESSVVRSGGFYVYYKDDVSKEGLPDYLFNDTDEVTVSLLVTFKNTDKVLWPYMNTLAVEKDIDIEKTMFSLVAASLKERAPTMRPGCVGMMLTRIPPAPQAVTAATPITPQVAAPYVAESYNLMNYRITASGGFDQSPFAMSAGPVEEDTAPTFDVDRVDRPRLAADDWDYKAVVPVFRFAASTIAPGRTGWRAFGVAADPDPKENPYRGLGGTVAIRVTWLDLFGNRMPLIPPFAELKVPVRYTDHLIALDKWPSLSADFMVLGQSGAATLHMRLRFNDTLYTAGTDDSLRAARADRAVYQTIYFQLTQPGVVATVSSSTDDAAVACTPTLIEYVLAIWRFLNAVVEEQTPVVPGEKLIEQPVADLNPSQVFHLAVSAAIARPSSDVSPDLRGPQDDPVWRVESPVSPRYDEVEPGAPLTLHDFAAAFEQALPHLSLATAAPRASSNVGNTRDIWVVRFGGTDGIVYDVAAQPVFLAPLPVSRRLLSTRLLLYPYVSGQPIWDQTPDEQSFSTVDLELMARELLAAVDLFLAPQLVVPAWLAWNTSPQAKQADNPILDVLAAKKSLAASIATRIGPVFADVAPTPGGRTDAVDKLEQQLLVRLSDLYTVDAIVQFPVTVQSRFSGVAAPRLFGKTIVEQPTAAARAAAAAAGRLAAGDEPRDYTFSTSAIALTTTADDSFLTFLFGTRDPSAASEVTLPLAFQRSHLQHDFVAVPGSDYEASQWLAFVTLATQEPIDWRLLPSRSRKGSLGTVSIPVPLRAYPPAPALLGQEGGSALPTAFAPSQSVNPALDLARRWVFSFSYRYESADQDTIAANVHFNVPEARTPRPRVGSAADPDLLDALVQFSSVWPALQADLDTSLVTAPDAALAVTTMQSFAWLVTRVRNAWAVWPTDGRPAVGVAAEITLDVEMRQRSVMQQGVETPVFAIEVIANSSGREYRPDVWLDGYTTEPWKPVPGEKSAAGAPWVKTYVFVKDGEYLAPEDGRLIAVRHVRVPDLDLLAEQNARAGVRIRRNETLSPQHETNSAFVYETPELRFGSVFVPILDPDVAIRVEGSTKPPPPPPPPTNTLTQYLSNFLVDVFTPSGGVPPVEGGVLRIEGGFRFTLDHEPGADALDVTLPIFLTQQVNVSTITPVPPETIPVATLAQGVAEAVLDWFDERGLTGRAGALALRLTLYATRQDEQLPVLQLNDVSLDMELVWNTVQESVR